MSTSNRSSFFLDTPGETQLDAGAISDFSYVGSDMAAASSLNATAPWDAGFSLPLEDGYTAMPDVDLDVDLDLDLDLDFGAGDGSVHGTVLPQNSRPSSLRLSRTPSGGFHGIQGIDADISDASFQSYAGDFTESSLSAAMDIPQYPPDIRELNPLGRFSPPDQEPAAASAIRSAMVQFSVYDSSSSYADSFYLTSPGQAESQCQTSAKATSSESEASYTSAKFQRPMAPMRHAKRRRRMVKAKVQELQGREERRPYQCTFCTDSFKTKYDWQRHETTLHLSLERWQCCLSGPVTTSSDGSTVCVFCSTPNPTSDHLNLHSYSACATKPLQARSFYRKDHLRQHLRLFHNGCAFNERMNSWVVSMKEIRSRCGFCDATMSTWAERAKHLARHFRQRADMKDWKGGRGFDEWVDELVENAMPAYIIAEQLSTVEPFSASQASHRLNGEDGAKAGDQASAVGLQSYRWMKRQLLGWIKDEITKGIVPTDEQMRMKCRVLIFGPDNHWDITWVDAPECLEEIKKEAGLISLPLSGGKNAFIGHPDGETQEYIVQIK